MMCGSMTQKSTHGHAEAVVLLLAGPPLGVVAKLPCMDQSYLCLVGTQPGEKASRKWRRCMMMCGLWTCKHGR